MEDESARIMRAITTMFIDMRSKTYYDMGDFHHQVMGNVDIEEEMKKIRTVYRRCPDKTLHHYIIEPIEMEMGTHS